MAQILESKCQNRKVSQDMSLRYILLFSRQGEPMFLPEETAFMIKIKQLNGSTDES